MVLQCRVCQRNPIAFNNRRGRKQSYLLLHYLNPNNASVQMASRGRVLRDMALDVRSFILYRGTDCTL